MDQADFPWRPLGQLLVEEELLDPPELEQALAEQRRTGRLLGQILVDQGHMSAVALARTLARQHGVELRAPSSHELSAPHDVGESARPARGSKWRPLGAVLVESGLVADADLQEALGEKRAHQDRRLGQILIRRGYISGAALEWALAEQHGLELESSALAEEVEAVVLPAAAGQPRYQVFSLSHEGREPQRTVLYEGANLLDAADFACDYVDREQPVAVEIERLHGTDRETVWTYSRERAAAEASDKSLVETFGFDPTLWGSGS